MGVRLMTEGAQEEISAQIDALTNAISGGNGASAGNYDSKNLPTEDSGRATANSIANLTAATKTKLSDLVTLSGAQTVSGQKTFACAIVGDLNGTADVAERLSTSAGAYNQPIYFSDGKPTAIAGTFGNSSTPIYLSNGVIKNCSHLATRSAMNNSFNGISVSDATITMTRFDESTTSVTVDNVEHSANAAKLDTSAGSDTWPVYFNGGLPVAINSITANVAMNATQLSSSAGNSIQPVYFSGGKPTAVSNIAAGDYVRLGGSASASENSAIAIGPSANAYSNQSIAIGSAAVANYDAAVAVGNYARAIGTNGVAVGRNAYASGANAIAIGSNARATYANSIAIGACVAATAANQVVIGAMIFPAPSLVYSSYSVVNGSYSNAYTNYTATRDGWFTAEYYSTSSGDAFGFIWNRTLATSNNSYMRALHKSDAGYWGADGETLWVPCRAGDIIYIQANRGIMNHIYNFSGTRTI